MTSLSTLFLGLALPCAVAGVILMMAMAAAVQARGHRVDWPFVRLYVLKYIHQYHTVTVQESGRPGRLFYPFIVSINLALLFTIVGLTLL